MTALAHKSTHKLIAKQISPFKSSRFAWNLWKYLYSNCPFIDWLRINVNNKTQYYCVWESTFLFIALIKCQLKTKPFHARRRRFFSFIVISQYYYSWINLKMAIYWSEMSAKWRRKLKESVGKKSRHQFFFRFI